MSLTAFGQERENMNWTDTTYPDYISKITDFGERAEWYKRMRKEFDAIEPNTL